MSGRIGVINKTYSYRINVAGGTPSNRIEYANKKGDIIEFFTDFTKTSYQIFIDCAQYRTLKINNKITVASNETCFVSECYSVSGIVITRLGEC